MSSQTFTNYSYGTDCFSELPKVLATYNFKKVVLIGGERALKAVQDEVLSILDEASITVTGSFVYGKIASESNVSRLKALSEVQEADVIIGVGGGQALDTTKMVAKGLGKSLFTISTICSTCSACSGIAVIYHDDHSFAFYERLAAPLHAFMNTRVIAEAPREYFWAGIGDGISKGPEVVRAIKEAEKRGFIPPHSASLGQAIAASSLPPLYTYGAQALADVDQDKYSQAVEEIMLAIIVSTAYASNMVVQPSFDLTTCHAHAFYNGTTVVKESRKHLHGSVVAFGVMVLHAYFDEKAELETVAQFNKKLGLPVCLADISLTEEDIPTIVEYSTNTMEYKHTPYDLGKFAEAIRIANRFGENL